MITLISLSIEKSKTSNPFKILFFVESTHLYLKIYSKNQANDF